MTETKTLGRLAVLFALAASTVFAVPTANAGTKEQLNAARKQLSELQGRISKQEAGVADLSAKLSRQAAATDRQQATFNDVSAQVRVINARLDNTRTDLAGSRETLKTRVRSMYMYGPVNWFDIFFESKTLNELASRVGFGSRLMRNDTDLILGLRQKTAALESEKAQRDALLRQESEQLIALKQQRRSLQNTFVTQQEGLANLAKSRQEISKIVESLASQLDAETLASARRTAGRGTPLTFGQWGNAFLSFIGAPQSRSNQIVMVTWQASEYTLATWNPLATTWSMPGATVYNSHGVKNYVSLEQGLQASLSTLSRPGHGYEAILSNLRAGSDAMTTARAINASDWCRGCTDGAYVTGLIPTVTAYYDRYASK